MRIWTKAAGAALALSLLLSAAVVVPAPAEANVTIDHLTNRYRTDRGLHTLRTPTWLWDIAKDRARAIRWDFGHNFAWAHRIPGCARGWGENIMYRIPAARNPARHGFFAFWHSPSHRENILGRWTVMGSSVYLAPNGGQYVAQLFVLRCR